MTAPRALDRAEIDRVNNALEGADPEGILAWAAARFGQGLTFATGFGVEGCVIIDMLATNGLQVDVLSLDTGVLFPETYDLWRALESRYALTIRAVRPTSVRLEEQAAEYGPEPWLVDPDACCQLRKVEPLRAALTDRTAWISSIRRDQTAARKEARPLGWDERFGLAKVSPLWRWTDEDIWGRVRTRSIPYNPLHDRSYPSIGCAPCTTPVAAGEDPRAGRWRGRDKKECGLHAPLPLAVIKGAAS
jgi:phosphoadenylyl-sulfate reductase (thioredoxin)